MLYSEVRTKIRDGDVIAFRGTGVFSTLIRLRTSSRITHVAHALWVRNRLFALEAREGIGVRMYPLSMYINQGCRCDWHKLLAIKYNIRTHDVILSAISHVGKNYASWLQFIRSWGLSRRLADWLQLPEDTDIDRFCCSEFVMANLQAGGYQGEGVKSAARTDPGDIVELPCLKREGELK